MNKFITKTFCTTRWILFLFFFCCLLLLANPVYAETTVSNSVRVSADSTGESHASVTTIINGEVVEDWSATSTEPIEYSHSYSETDDSVTVNTSSHATEQNRLKTLIAQLEAIISFYVSLLNH